MKPINNNLLVKLDAVKTQSAGGVIFTEKTKKRDQFATVLAVGPRAQHIKVGQRILFNNGQFKLMPEKYVGESDVAIISEDEVIGYFEK